MLNASDCTIDRGWGLLTFDCPMLVHPLYEKELFDFIGNQHWPRCPVFVDGGAHQGIWTTYLASCWPASLVFAFEPQPDNYRYLLYNVQQLRLGNVFISNCALSNQNGWVMMDGGPGDNSAYRIRDKCSVEANEALPCRRLDSLQLPRIDLLRLDVEYHEEFVLMGAAGSIFRDRPTILVDIHHGMQPGVEQILMSWDYQFRELSQCIPTRGHCAHSLWCTPKL